MIICDTDVMVDILRGQPSALAWLSSVSIETIALPGIVMMELIQGCRSKTEQLRMQKALKDYPLLWPPMMPAIMPSNTLPAIIQVTASVSWMQLSLKLL